MNFFFWLQLNALNPCTIKYKCLKNKKRGSLFQRILDIGMTNTSNICESKRSRERRQQQQQQQMHQETIEEEGERLLGNTEAKVPHRRLGHHVVVVSPSEEVGYDLQQQQQEQQGQRQQYHEALVHQQAIARSLFLVYWY